MAYYTRTELEDMHFKFLGKHVMVSTLARIYHPECTELGDFTRIDDFCVLMGNVRLGNYVHIAMYSHLGGGTHGIFMDDHSECAYRCAIITHSSDYSLETLHAPCVPEYLKKARSGPVYIGRYSLIGYDSLVMPGVTIQEGCSFAAFSYISSDTKAWGLYSGKPLQRIRENSRACLDTLEAVEFEINKAYHGDDSL